MAVVGVDLLHCGLLPATVAMGVGGNPACYPCTFRGSRVMEDLPPDRFWYQASQIQETDEDLCGNQKVDGALSVDFHHRVHRGSLSINL